MDFRTRYWHDPQARAAFKAFIRQIHGLDFTAWDAAGYWDDDYIPFSYFEGDRVVASLCIYTMPALVNGERCKVAQVSGVGTLPGYRRQGLNRQLHARALAWALQAHRFAFLYADEDAFAFYRACGFQPIDDFALVVDLPASAGADVLQKVDVGLPAEREAIYRLACERTPASHTFFTLNPKLVMFHLLYSAPDDAWRVPGRDVVLLARREPQRTVVYDILARELPAFDELASWIAPPQGGECEFRFHTDRLNVPGARLKPLRGHDIHVMGSLALGAQPVFPFTAKA